MSVEPSGEYFIPGRFEKRIEDEHLERYRFATRYVSEKTVLDIACGVGYGTHSLGEAGAKRVDGVDISETTVAYAKQHYQTEAVQFHLGDVTQFDPGYRYDVITSFETIEHVDDYAAALSNLYKLLHPGGLLIISTPNRPMSWRPGATIDDKPHNPYHVREFNLPEFIGIVKQAGFVFEPGDVHGQRQFIYIRNRYIRKLYSMVFHPEDNSEPMVQPLKANTLPKYIVITAHKPN